MHIVIQTSLKTPHNRCIKTLQTSLVSTEKVMRGGEQSTSPLPSFQKLPKVN